MARHFEHSRRTYVHTYEDSTVQVVNPNHRLLLLTHTHILNHSILKTEF